MDSSTLKASLGVQHEEQARFTGGNLEVEGTYKLDDLD